MFWFILSILTAFSEATKDLFSKKSLQKIDEYAVAWCLRIFSLPFLLPLLFIIEIPALDQTFFIALITVGILDGIVAILYMKAIKMSPLSVTTPMLTFTPLFLLIMSPLILGEFPSLFGLVGILLIVFGAYSLNIKESRRGFLSPFKALLKEKGPMLMLLVAFIWSITSNIDKIGVQHSNPIFWAISVNVFLSVLLFPVMILKSQKRSVQISGNLKSLVPIGLFTALTFIFQMTAISLTLVPYVISIKRTSAIFCIIYGYFFFKETRIKERLLGASIMILGVLLIALL